MGRGDSVAAEKYGRPSVALHWMMAALLTALCAIGFYMVGLPKRTPEVAYYYNMHKSLGLVALMLAALRAGWRLRTSVPVYAIGAHVSPVQAMRASIAHRMLYVCMLLIPLSGFAGSNFGKHPVKFFGYPLPLLGWDDPALHVLFRQVHEALVWVLCVLVAMHVIAVIYHSMKSGRVFLQRMLP